MSPGAGRPPGRSAPGVKLVVSYLSRDLLGDEREAIMATMQAPPRARIHEGAFVNEPLTDFTREENACKMRAAIEKVRGQLGREYDLIIGGRRVKTADKIKSINPAKP